MTLRRHVPLKASRGTVIPTGVRIEVLTRDQGCVGFGRFPGPCVGPLELDHVRASHGMGLKSETTVENMVALCGSCHRYKTEHGREARPVLLEYLGAFYGEGRTCSTK